MKYIVLLLILAAVAGLAYIRLTPIPVSWHVDPADATRSGNPNDYLVAPGGDQDAVSFADSPAELMAHLDALVMAQPRVTRLAGSIEDAHVTYVQRTALMGYPDTISVRATGEGEGARLMIWSRSRYGYADFGVNKARVEGWLDQMTRE